jgi:hypothetical protein
VAPGELDKENTPSQSLIVVLLKPLHCGVGRNKEGHVFGAVGTWNSLAVAVCCLLLVKSLLPFVVNLLFLQGLTIKLIH